MILRKAARRVIDWPAARLIVTDGLAAGDVVMQPTSGSHVMLGVDLTRASDHALTEFRNRHIGFVFQFHNLLPDFTALENVIFPTAVREGRETASARMRGQELLVRMGLAERVHFPTANLSGGQKQRVAVARALMNRPELVLADEPTGNLDRVSVLQVMDLIAEINRDEGTTFLISTHDEKIAALCRRQIVVGDGLVTCLPSGGDGLRPALCGPGQG